MGKKIKMQSQVGSRRIALGFANRQTCALFHLYSYLHLRRSAKSKPMYSLQ